MADCERYIVMISSLVDCELTADEEAELRAHLESCDNCRRIYETFEGISGAIAEDVTEPPKSLSRGVMNKVETQGKRRKAPFFAFGRFTAIAACLVIILFGASKFGWFKSASSPDSVSEEASLSVPDSAESKPESQTESSSNPSPVEEKSEVDKAESDEGMMFTAPTNENFGNDSSDNVTSDGSSLNELFLSDEIKILKDSYNITDSTDPIIISDDNMQAELLDLLDYSGINITEPKLSDTPDYTLFFPDETELYLYSVDGSIYCKLKNCKTVYVAVGTMREFESLIEQAQSTN